MTLAIHIAKVILETKTLFYTYLTLLPKIRKLSPSVSQSQLQASTEGVLLASALGVGVGYRHLACIFESPICLL